MNHARDKPTKKSKKTTYAATPAHEPGAVPKGEVDSVEKLKPCPFCGGEALYSDKKVKIFCKKCEAQICGVKILKKVPNYPEFLMGLWNRRT